MTRGLGTESGEWLLVVAILVGVAVLAALTTFAFDELRWLRRYATSLFFAIWFAIWVGAALVIGVIRDHL